MRRGKRTRMKRGDRLTESSKSNKDSKPDKSERQVIFNSQDSDLTQAPLEDRGVESSSTLENDGKYASGGGSSLSNGQDIDEGEALERHLLHEVQLQCTDDKCTRKNDSIEHDTLQQDQITNADHFIIANSGTVSGAQMISQMERGHMAVQKQKIKSKDKSNKGGTDPSRNTDIDQCAHPLVASISKKHEFCVQRRSETSFNSFAKEDGSSKRNL